MINLKSSIRDNIIKANLLYLVFKLISYLIPCELYSALNANSKDFFSDLIIFENQITFMVNDFLFCASIIISGFSERNLEMNTMLFLSLLFHFYYLPKKKSLIEKRKQAKKRFKINSNKLNRSHCSR